MWPNPQFPVDLATFTEEILNGKLNFLYNVFPYDSHHSEITNHEGILMKKQRIIVSTIIHAEMKLIIHQGFFKLENSKNRARQALFGH